MTTSVPPLALYVHLPWCVQKCPYCDFNSFAAGNGAPRERYVDALLRDLDAESQRAGERELISIFLGGGTPSLFTPDEIARILAACSERYGFVADIEITMEANPGTVECGDPAGYLEAGVNRLSIGAQSFNADALKTLGRIHSVDDITRSVCDAREAGFEDINLDVMYGLPDQDVESALADIDHAAALKPQHLSWYQLTLEPNTVFHARPPAGLPDDDSLWAIQQAGQARLAGLGFEQYEISAYARGGRRCVHNLNYWSFGDYLGVGAGAHGKVTDGAGIWRYSKPANPLAYMESMERGNYEPELSDLEPDERFFEFMLNALRLTGGFDEPLYRERTGLSVEALRERMKSALESGLVEQIGAQNWRASAFGRRFLNDLQADFLPG